MISELEKTAFHEAGHCVTCAVLGGRVKSATIVACVDYNGITHHRQPPLCERKIATLLAGGYAVWELEWRQHEKMNSGCYQDLEDIDELLGQWYHGEAPPREQCDEFTEAEPLVLQVIANYWAAIETVAKFLLQHETIPGRLVHAIVAQHREKSERKEQQSGNFKTV